MGFGVEDPLLGAECYSAWVVAGQSLSVWQLVALILVALVAFWEAMTLALGMALVGAEEWKVASGELVTLDWLVFLVDLESLALG